MKERQRYRPYLLSSREDEIRWWPPQPDWGPTHVKYPWELTPGKRYLLHKIGVNKDTGRQEEEIEEFEVWSVPQRGGIAAHQNQKPLKRQFPRELWCPAR